MKNKLLIISILTSLFFSCNPCRHVARHPECFSPDTVVKTDIRIEHDSVTWIQGDSSLYEMIFECDSNNNVLLKQLEEYKGKSIITKVIYKNNRLQIQSFTDSIAVLNKVISNLKTHVEYVKNPVNDELKRQNAIYQNRLHNRRWLWWYFGASIVAIAAFLYFKIFK